MAKPIVSDSAPTITVDENGNVVERNETEKERKAREKKEAQEAKKKAQEEEKARKEDLKKRKEQLKKDKEEADLREEEKAVKDRLEGEHDNTRRKVSEDKKTVEDPYKQYELTNPNQALADVMQQVYGNSAAPTDGYVRPEYTDVVNARMQSVDDLADTLGVNFTYDRDEIEKIYQNATMAALQMEQQSGAERQYYKHLADAQNTAMDAIRQQYGQAVATGANKGMQAANMLSAILGTTQTANDEATQLAADRQALVNKYAQQMRQDSVDALNYSNEMANSIGGLSHQFYNDMIQQKTAELSYNQGINTDYAGYMASKYTADANRDAALAQAAAGVYNNNQSAIAGIEAAIETARGNENVAKIK